MATLALSLAGQFVGGAVGGPIGATIGWALGALAGSAIDSTLFADRPEPAATVGADLRRATGGRRQAVPGQGDRHHPQVVAQKRGECKPVPGGATQAVDQHEQRRVSRTAEIDVMRRSAEVRGPRICVREAPRAVRGCRHRSRMP